GLESVSGTRPYDSRKGKMDRFTRRLAWRAADSRVVARARWRSASPGGSVCRGEPSQRRCLLLAGASLVEFAMSRPRALQTCLDDCCALGSGARLDVS